MERTEDQKVSQDPITVTLGGKEYEVKPLVIVESRKWRKEVAGLLASLPEYARIDTSDIDAVQGAVGKLLSSMPDSIIDLFFQYAKELPREEIEKVATDAEVAEALTQVVSIAFPLVNSLTTLVERMSQ